MPKRVLIFCAHSDDQVLGAGGYINRLSKEGSTIRTIICSFGEQSHPHLKEMEISKIRVHESEKADKMLGGSGVLFLGLREGSIRHDFETRGYRAHVVRQIRRFRPARILTHSPDDPHPDHRAVFRLLLDLHEEACPTAEVYTFDVWNLFNLKRRRPRLIIDITQTFKNKIDALKAFRSQKTALASLLWSVYVRAVWWGYRRGSRYGEVFYKVK